MATNFPNSLDSFTNPVGSNNLSSPSHADQHANVNDAVEAIEAALLDGSPLKIDDANNRVGVGTTSPYETLDVQGSIGFSTGGNRSAGSLYSDVNWGLITTAAQSSPAVAEFAWFNAGDTERMRIHPSGAVTMPYQPAFLIYTGGHTKAAGTWEDISLLSNRTIDYNIGNHWSNSTGLFTAPVAGYYLFYAGGWCSYNGTGNRYAIAFHINAGLGGDWKYISGANTSSVDTPMAMSMVVRYMNANEYMRTTMFSAVGFTLGTSSHKFYYGGYLLG